MAKILKNDYEISILIESVNLKISKSRNQQ